MKRKDIDTILHPKSIAVVGASSNLNSGATMFLNALLEIGYEGKIYPVNPNVEEALGLKTYPSLLDIPRNVDHVIVGVPASIGPSIIEQALKKGVRSIHFFTSGFAEIGTQEGIALQKKVTDLAQGKIRVIGPNCMGIYHPKMKIAFDRGQLPIPGGAAFVSQSGGLATYFSRNAIQEGNFCSKVLSIGNSSDLKLVDFLEYFGEDQETKTISMYIEGLGEGEGKKLLEVLRNTTQRKPVLIWKGGQTDVGARTALSHTGAMASGYELWQALARQFGAILVDSIEEMHDFIKLYRLTSPPESTRSCLVNIGGGASVKYADVCSKVGIDLPELQKETQDALLEFIPPVGTIRRNPVDASGSGWKRHAIEKTIRTIGCDPDIDSIIFVTQLLLSRSRAGGSVLSPQQILRHQVNAVVSAAKHLNIPVVCNNQIPFEDLTVEALRQYTKKELEKNGIPTFPSIKRTAKALKRYYEYNRFVKQRWS